MIASTSAWYFFVLLNAFYGGALTMFFTSEITIPFNDIRDVIRSYPDWKLQILTGSDALYQPKALAGDPEYMAFWERVESDPEQSIYPNIEEGLKRLLEDQVVIDVSSAMFRGYFMEHPFHQQELKIFGKQPPIFNALAVTKNSPISPVFKAGMRYLRENGILAQLEQDWMGQEVESRSAVSKLVLSPGQVSH